MKISLRLILFVSLLLMVTGMGFLTGCSLTGSSNSEVDSRITELEADVKANGEAIAALRQQVQDVGQKVDAIKSSSIVTTITPPASTTPPATTAPPPPKPPSTVIPTSLITLGNLTVTPAEVKPDEVVTVSISVTNTSANEGSYKVVMVEKAVPAVTSNVLEYTNPVTLKAGETKTVTFTTSRSLSGTYSVEIGTKSGQYFVNSPPSE